MSADLAPTLGQSSYFSMTDADLLALAIKQSGLSAKKFAEDMLVRDARSVYRWLAGETGVPDRVRDYLETYVQEHSAPARGTRRKVV